MDQSGGPERPTGELPMGIGWLLIAIGVVAIFVAGGSRSFEGTILGYLIAQLGIGVGVLLVSLGYIVRAIWFLPGRSVNQATAPTDPVRVEMTACDWCAQQVPRPNKPCAVIDPDKMARLAPSVENPKCRDALAAHGFELAQ